MKERPILFNAQMVRAILEGRKTHTRRVVEPQPVGMKYYCREMPTYRNRNPNAGTISDGGTWGFEIDGGGFWGINFLCPFGVPGDILWVRETLWRNGGYVATDDAPFANCGKVPSIFMPKWKSRINLLIKSIKVERVQEITQEDAQAEGVDYIPDAPAALDHRTSFAGLWDKINKKRGFGWDSNPWVWVIEFEREQ